QRALLHTDQVHFVPVRGVTPQPTVQRTSPRCQHVDVELVQGTTGGVGTVDDIQAVLFLPEHSPRAAGSVEQLTNLLQRRVLLGEDSNRAPPLHHVGQRRVGAADSAQIWGGQRNGPVGGWPGKIQWPV